MWIFVRIVGRVKDGCSVTCVASGRDMGLTLRKLTLASNFFSFKE